MLHAHCHTRKNGFNTINASYAARELFHLAKLVERKIFQAPHSTKNRSENRKPFSVFYPISRSEKRSEKIRFSPPQISTGPKNGTLKGHLSPIFNFYS